MLAASLAGCDESEPLVRDDAGQTAPDGPGDLQPWDPDWKLRFDLRSPDAAVRDAPPLDAPPPDAPPPDAPPPDVPFPDLQLKPDQGLLGQTAPCLKGTNVLYMQGDKSDWITQGKVKHITSAPWSIKTKISATGPTLIGFDTFTPALYSVAFSSMKLGTHLKPGTYTGAERYPFESAGKPGMSISAEHRGCNKLCGAFTIHKLTMSGSKVAELLVSFVQYCECSTNKLWGCFHYKK